MHIYTPRRNREAFPLSTKPVSGDSRCGSGQCGAQGSVPGALQLNAGNWVLPRRDTRRSSAVGILASPCRLPKLATICARLRLSMYVCVCSREAGARTPLERGKKWRERPRQHQASCSAGRCQDPWQPGTEASKPSAHLFRAGVGRLLRRRFPGLLEAFAGCPLAARWPCYLRRGSESPAVRMIWCQPHYFSPTRQSSRSHGEETVLQAE